LDSGGVKSPLFEAGPRYFAALMLFLALALLAPAHAQPHPRTAREYPTHAGEAPTWSNPPAFAKDVFTFVRIAYHTHNATRRHMYEGGSLRWMTDYPDADLNLAYRLQQLTSIRTDPDCRVLDLLDPELSRYPFIYMVEPGDLYLHDDEVPVLRKYLLNGGTLMVDDFWGEAEWANMADELRKVFPDREFQDIPREHPLFHCVFDLPNDLNLQCPNVRLGTLSQYNGITWERTDAKEMHVRAIYDDKGRIMVIATHNTDNGDGWEREGDNVYYFREFSEKKSYPLTINIFFYLMTH
jgi:hypothetical protein